MPNELQVSSILEGKLAILKAWLARPEMMERRYIAALNRRIGRLRARLRYLAAGGELEDFIDG